MQTPANTMVYRAAVGLTLVAALMLIWLSLGVGIIGADGDPANLMYFIVIAIAIVGAGLARLRPAGMARTLYAMALTQAAIAAVAGVAGLGMPWSPPLEIALLNGFFVVLFSGCGWMFQRSVGK